MFNMLLQISDPYCRKATEWTAVSSPPVFASDMSHNIVFPTECSFTQRTGKMKNPIYICWCHISSKSLQVQEACINQNILILLIITVKITRDY